jgi:hypothetical protein
VWRDESGAKHPGHHCASDYCASDYCASDHRAPEKRSALMHRYEIIIIKSSRSGSAMKPG